MSIREPGDIECGMADEAPQQPSGSWVVRIEGGPAFAANAALACRLAAREKFPAGPTHTALIRLSEALERAQYGEEAGE